MQNGVISTENFAQVLRSISQRRRQGTLEVHCGERVLKASFNAGRIVEVVENEDAAPRDLAQRFCDAGIVVGGDWIDTVSNYAELYEQLCSHTDEVSPELFAFALRHRILDKLYGMDLGGGSYYTFHIEMVSVERDYSPSVSIGQLLLDLVAFHEDRGAFAANFAQDATVEKGSDAEGGLTAEEERLVWSIQPAMTVESLRVRSLLSMYHFQEALTSLFRRGVIRFAGSSATVNQPAFGADLFAALDASIDQAFDDITIHPAVRAEGSTAEPAVMQQAATASPVTAVTAFSLAENVARLNAWAVQQPKIPQAVILILFFAAVVGPLLFWRGVLWELSGR